VTAERLQDARARFIHETLEEAFTFDVDPKWLRVSQDHLAALEDDRQMLGEALRQAGHAFAQYAVVTNDPPASAVDDFVDGFKQSARTVAVTAAADDDDWRFTSEPVRGGLHIGPVGDLTERGEYGTAQDSAQVPAPALDAGCVADKRRRPRSVSSSTGDQRMLTDDQVRQVHSHLVGIRATHTVSPAVLVFSGRDLDLSLNMLDTLFGVPVMIDSMVVNGTFQVRFLDGSVVTCWWGTR